MLSVAAASGRLADAVLSILIEWPPCAAVEILLGMATRSGSWTPEHRLFELSLFPYWENAQVPLAFANRMAAPRK